MTAAVSTGSGFGAAPMEGTEEYLNVEAGDSLQNTTFIAGIEAIKKGIGRPIGSLTQMGTIRLGKRTDKKSPLIKDFIGLADLKNIVFGGWDIYSDNSYEAALKAI